MGYAFRSNPNGKLAESEEKDSNDEDVTVYMDNLKVSEEDTKVEESDDDEDDEDDEEDEVIVTKQPVKKAVVKPVKK
jgi:hypothetical protein